MTTAVLLSAMTQAVRAATERFCDLIGGLPDPAAPLPGSTWTVREVVAHVVTVAPRYAQGARHEGEWVADPRDLAALNDGRSASSTRSTCPPWPTSCAPGSTH
jgi:nicotinamidase-related amidase